MNRPISTLNELGEQIKGPVVPIDVVFRGQKYPKGEEHDYVGLHAYRSNDTSAMPRAIDAVGCFAAYPEPCSCCRAPPHADLSAKRMREALRPHPTTYCRPSGRWSVLAQRPHGTGASEEKRKEELLREDVYDELRRAAEVRRASPRRALAQPDQSTPRRVSSGQGRVGYGPDIVVCVV